MEGIFHTPAIEPGAPGVGQMKSRNLPTEFCGYPAAGSECRKSEINDMLDG
jgi:hypothetical protein